MSNNVFFVCPPLRRLSPAGDLMQLKQKPEKNMDVVLLADAAAEISDPGDLEQR
jgi:hypothetical protein